MERSSSWEADSGSNGQYIHFAEHEGLLPRSQVTAFELYPEPVECSQHHHTLFL
jgi:hypothetical protein